MNVLLLFVLALTYCFVMLQRRNIHFIITFNDVIFYLNVYRVVKLIHFSFLLILIVLMTYHIQIQV